ncbi:hypothetical protein [uncultured Flavobacterium sp.]|uniref:hypothetical protein n=1 Tax=uncultured Flavobacterium sp. TaxID=165435 RepID=UPI0025DAFD79|nr:hypothetical protein [uncultured Flavobacterium sp.]
MIQLKKIYCLTSVFNDWDSFTILCDRIEGISKQLVDYDFEIIAINDGSTDFN